MRSSGHDWTRHRTRGHHPVAGFRNRVQGRWIMSPFHKANLNIDHPALLEFFHSTVEPLPITTQGRGYFGGWAIQSGTGDYTDGWSAGRHAMTGSTTAGEITVDAEKWKALFPIEPKDMIRPTQLYAGPIAPLMDTIIQRCQAVNRRPSRARITRLEPGSSLKFHRDDHAENWRLHLPILTNSECYFEWDLSGEGTPTHRLHMEPGTAWFVRVDQLHRFVNGGTTPRVHLLMSLIGWRESMIEVFNNA